MVLRTHPTCKECGKTLLSNPSVYIDGRCYKCHAEQERKPLLEEIEQLKAENKKLTDAHTAPGFFVVIRQDDSRLHRHETSNDAKAEAERLAMKHPGSTFYVLETTAAYRIGIKPDVLNIEIMPGDDIPF